MPRKEFLARFEEFELDTRTGELLKNGVPASRLSQQQLSLLLALIDRPGELVLREDLRQRLWPGGTVVEFEDSINVAIKRVRQALGDSPQQPRFIETLTRRGYRWKTSVAWKNGAGAVVPPPLPAEQPAQQPQKTTSYRTFGALIAATSLVLLIGLIFLSRLSQVSQPKLTQLTWNSSEIPVRTATISPDGKYLAYTDLNGIHIKILSTNEMRTVPQPESIHGNRVDWAVIDWFPDSSSFIAEISPFDEGCAGCDPFSTWSVSILGGPPRKIRDGSAAESISPDGSQIAYTAVLGNPGGKEIWIMDRDGGNPRKIVQTDREGWLRYAKWSPDGKRLSYIHLPETGSANIVLESKPFAGGDPVTILEDANHVHDYTWLPDGNLVYVSGEPNHTGCNYWKVHVDSVTGRPTAQPKKITNWAGFCLERPSRTEDGKKLVFIEKADHSAIYVSQTKNSLGEITNPKLLSLTDASNQLAGWTDDSHSVVYASDRDRVAGFYRQPIDSDVSESIQTRIPDIGSGGVISPDGKWILFTAPNNKADAMAPTQIARIPVAGGPAEYMLSGDLWGIRCARSPSDLCVLKEWSQDSKSILFSSVDPLKGRIHELFRMPADDDTNWQLAPDGMKIVLFGVQRPIRIRYLRDQSVRELKGKQWAGVDYITWTNDSAGFYGSTPTQQGDVLMHLDLNGNVQKVWESRGSFQTSALPSPDGKSLAIQSWSLRSNVWMLENF